MFRKILRWDKRAVFPNMDYDNFPDISVCIVIYYNICFIFFLLCHTLFLILNSTQLETLFFILNSTQLETLFFI